MSPELPRDVHESVKRLGAEGDAFARQRRYAEAIQKYKEAWQLLPQPTTDWEAATWLLAAIGDAQFLNGRYQESQDTFTNAIANSAGGLGNPFLHLRRGESLFELGRVDEAADELMRAYMGAGPGIFKTEDPKFLSFLGTRAKL